AWTYTTNDTTVPEAAGYTALYNALNAVGFDVSQTGSNGTVASGKALSVHSYYDGYFNGGGHDGMFATYSSTFFKNFLTEVKNQVEQSRNGTDFFPFF
ncbi:hypothetical protein KC946_01595, partial [Candidatus Saccharibacteria bacterium]|nr:hypothetical protein [Candidatus Saccharibacteria bacterium]